MAFQSPPAAPIPDEPSFSPAADSSMSSTGALTLTAPPALTVNPCAGRQHYSVRNRRQRHPHPPGHLLHPGKQPLPLDFGHLRHLLLRSGPGLSLQRRLLPGPWPVGYDLRRHHSLQGRPNHRTPEPGGQRTGHLGQWHPAALFPGAGQPNRLPPGKPQHPDAQRNSRQPAIRSSRTATTRRMAS